MRRRATDRSAGPPRLRLGAPAERRMLADVLRVSDLAGAVLACGLAALVASAPAWPDLALERISSLGLGLGPVALLLVLVLLWRIAFAACGVCDVDRSPLGRRQLPAIAKATTLATLLLLAAAPLLGFTSPARLSLLAGVFWLGTAMSAFGSRLLLGLVLRPRNKGRRNVLIVGTNRRAIRFADRLQRGPDSRSQVIGFVDDDWSGMAAFRAQGGRVACDQKNFASFVRDHVVDEVVIAAPLDVVRMPWSTVFEACETAGIRLRLLTSALRDLELAALGGEGADDTVLLTVCNGTVEGWSALGKRVADASLAAVALLVTSPLLLVTALLVATTSRGPVFFTQERVGLNKRRFRMIKFRTMVPGAEQQLPELRHLNEVGGPVFKLRNDPRLTPVGKLLRTWSIDELPQLLNVLKGDMSLVGPRPLPLTDFEGFEGDRYRRRLSVRPGLTGLWQVSGRSNIGFDEWMELDLEYIDRWSSWVDMEILARTLPAVLRREGAE